MYQSFLFLQGKLVSWGHQLASYTLQDVSLDKVTLSRLVFGPLPFLTFISWLLKLPDIILRFLHTDISVGIPVLFVFIWHYFILDTQRSNQPISWYSQFYLFILKCDYHLVQTAKFQQDVQGDLLVTTLDLAVSTNITTTSIFQVHSW